MDILLITDPFILSINTCGIKDFILKSRILCYLGLSWPVLRAPQCAKLAATIRNDANMNPYSTAYTATGHPRNLRRTKDLCAARWGGAAISANGGRMTFSTV